MFSFEICDIFKKTYFEEHLLTDSSINEKQQEPHALLGKPIARAISASRKLQLLEFDSIAKQVLLC